MPSEKTRPGIQYAVNELIEATAYYRAERSYALHLERLSKWFGVPSVALSVLTGVGILALLQQNNEEWAKWVAALLAFLAGLFTALQTYWGFGTTLKDIRGAAIKHHGLVVTLKTMITVANLRKCDLTEEQIDKIRAASEAIDEPPIPTRYLDAARRSAQSDREHYVNSGYQQQLVVEEPFQRRAAV